MNEKKTWSKVVRELLALHESFRRLNFPPEELFVDLYGLGGVQFALRSNGQTFVVDVARGVDVDQVDKEWQEAVAWWNGPATDEERMEIYSSSDLASRRTELVVALHKRGLMRK